MIKFKNLMLLTRKLDSSVNLWTTVFGFSLVNQSEIIAELKDESNFWIILREISQEAYCSTGYNPIINLQIPVEKDLSELLVKL